MFLSSDNLIQFVPVVLCWYLWKGCNEAIFQSVLAHQHLTVGSLTWLLQFFVMHKPLKVCSDTWAGCNRFYIPALWRKQVLMTVHWKYLALEVEYGWPIAGNPCPVGGRMGGCVIRNEVGEVVHSASYSFVQCSSLLAELLALSQGFQLCFQANYSCIQVETDSMLVVNWLRDSPDHWS